MDCRSKKMDYDDVLKHTGGYGKFHKVTLLLLAIYPAIEAPTSFMLNFLLGNQLHRCHVPQLDDGVYSTRTFYSGNQTTNITANKCSITMNGTNLPCNEWVYDEETYKATLISKFNMVCDDTIISSHILFSHFLGAVFFAVTCGFFCDTFGRKPAIVISVFLLVIPNIIRPWMPSIYLVAVCEFFNALGCNLAYNAPLIIGTELVGQSHRVYVSFLMSLAFNLGGYVLLFFAYFIRDWQHLIWTISAPISLSFLVLFFIPESPRWLLVKGRNEEAMKIIIKAAEWNGKTVDFQKEDIMFREENTVLSLWQGIKKLIKSKSLVVWLLILFVNWFAISLTYYGISMNVGDFGSNVYVTFAISNTSELVAYIFCYFGDKFPRKKLYCTSVLVGGVSCLSTIFTSIYGGSAFHWLTVGLAMVGKLGISTAFLVVFIITSEIFPTTTRVTVFGFCNIGARLGSLSSSYIGKLGVLVDSVFGDALPLIVFGLAGTVAGILSLWLPETRHVKLPDTLEDCMAVKRAAKDTKSENCDESAVMFKTSYMQFQQNDAKET